MKGLLGWCFRHPVIVVVFLFCLIAVLYRQAIFNLQEHQQPSSQAPAVINESVEAGEVSGLKTPAIIDNPVETGEVASGMDKAEPKSTTAAKNDLSDTASVTSSTSDVPSLVEIEAVEAAAGMHFRPETEPDEEQGQSFDHYIQQARMAYWSGDELGAIKKYQELSLKYPANPVPYGEMANVYFKQGKVDQAVVLYQKTINLLAQSGTQEQAEKLYRLLERVIPGKLREPRHGVVESDSTRHGKPQTIK